MIYKYREIFYHISRAMKKTDLFISETENKDLIQNLTPSEHLIYSYFKYSPIHNPTIDYFQDNIISKSLNLSPKTVKNCKSSLKQKGYIYISKFKDEFNKSCMRVAVGKESVEIVKLGIRVEIPSKKIHNKILGMFPLNDPNLSDQQKNKVVEEANKYIVDHPEEFR